MNNVKILDEHVINKIAAGEVIENPSCVLKELLENSLDAGAKRIHVDIEQSGMKLIRVVDNGGGMSREDATLAIKRHATSKLRTDKDLYALSTLGFRGEALPSMAAVSKFLIRTATANDIDGTRIQIDGGKIIDITDDNIAPGTIIEVKNLFYNVPARKKFVRSYQGEKMSLMQVFIKLALGYIHVDFALKDGQKEVYRFSPAKNMIDRIAGVFGHDFTADLIQFHREIDDITISGYVSHPQLCRSTRSGQYIFVNKRVVQSHQISHAVQRAYGSLLPSGRFPIMFMNITTDPAQLDVNVHPTKKEIKFSNFSKLGGEIEGTVESVLKKSKLIFDIKEQTKDLKKINLSYNIPRFNNAEKEVPKTEDLDYFQPAETSDDDNRDNSFREKIDSCDKSEDDKDEFISQLNALIKSDSDNDEEPCELEGVDLDSTSSSITVLGQVGKCFLIGEGRDGLVIIDQHAAHERINFEKIMTLMRQGISESQTLLFPVTYHVNKTKKDILLSKLDILIKAGIGISDFGSDTLLIDSLPTFVSATAIHAVLDDVVEESPKSSSDSIQNWQMKVAKMLACRSSVKAADKLDIQEMQQLVDDLLKTQTPYTCPHGRPTIIRMTYEQLRHHFKRE